MSRYGKFNLALLVIFALLLAACGQAATPAAQPTAAPAAQPTTAAPAPEATSAPAATAAQASGGATTPVNIAVIVKSVTSTYWKTVGAGVDAAVKADPNLKASFLGANEETDIEGQIRIIEAQIAAKVSAIAIAPSQADQVQPTLQKAVDAGIPVVLIDTNLPDFAAKSAFVGTDNKLGGQKAGEYIAKALKAGDKVAIIRGAAGDPVHNLREQGASEPIKAAGLNLVAVQPADSDRAKGQSVAENLLTANPDLKAIYATNDEMALGALQAATAAGRTDMIIIGFDASPDALQAIADGKLTGSIAQFAAKIGELGVQTAAKVARGEKVDAFVNTGVDLVTKDNVGQYKK